MCVASGLDLDELQEVISESCMAAFVPELFADKPDGLPPTCSHIAA
jgi:hypothetical protein